MGAFPGGYSERDHGGMGLYPHWSPGAEPLVRGKAPLKLNAFWPLHTQKRGKFAQLLLILK